MKNNAKATELTTRASKTAKLREKRKEIKVSEPQQLSGTYNVIYADPPWQYSFSKSANREIENKYPTMTLDEIKAVCFPCEKNAVLYMWATAPKLLEALDVMEAWGFKYKTHMVWDKQLLGMGYWARGQHEILLIGTKGKFSPPAPELRESSVFNVSTIYSEKRTKHSKKPDYYYDFLERMFPNGKYLELFARQRYNEKWTVWGNQAPQEDCTPVEKDTCTGCL